VHRCAQLASLPACQALGAWRYQRCLAVPVIPAGNNGDESG